MLAPKDLVKAHPKGEEKKPPTQEQKVFKDFQTDFKQGSNLFIRTFKTYIPQCNRAIFQVFFG